MQSTHKMHLWCNRTVNSLSCGLKYNSVETEVRSDVFTASFIEQDSRTQPWTLGALQLVYCFTVLLEFYSLQPQLNVPGIWERTGYREVLCAGQPARGHVLTLSIPVPSRGK